MDAAIEMSPGSRFWRVLRAPLMRMLLLSLSLHLAVVMVVQPRPYKVAPDVVVINARLSGQPAPLAEAPLEPVPSESVPEPLPVEVPMPEPVPEAEPATEAPEPEPPSEVKSLPHEGSGLASIPVLIDTHWYEARQLDIQPKASQPILPVYPLAAIQAKLPGSVKLKLKIDEFGVVQEVELEEAEPPGIFDESALEAFRQGLFVPARKDGRAVRALIHIRVNYEPDVL